MKIEDWEEIQVKDIRKGDLLQVTKVTDKGTIVVTSKAMMPTYDGKGWELELNYTVLDIAQVIGQKTTILRERPKYEFPTGIGAVIEAVNSEEGGRMIKFVHYRPHWIPVGGGAAWSQGNICQSYTRFNTLSEGITL